MLRYIVERISDGVFLDLDFPIKVERAGQKLMGAGGFAGTVAPDVGGLRSSDGSLLVEPYATYIHEEADGQIRGTWLVTYSAQDGDQWKIEGEGFSVFLSGRPYEGEYRGVRVDPVDVARHIVEHAQSFTGADAGITVVGSSTVFVGTDSDEKVATALTEFDSAVLIAETAKKNLDAARAQAKADSTPANKALVETRKTQSEQANKLKKNADEALKAAKQQASEDGGAWKILWWDTPDCFTVFQDAVDAAGMEWYEWSGWNPDRTKVLKQLRVVDRVGSSRDDVVFADDVNIVDSPVVTDQSSEYANTVIAIGAGEGADSLRVTVGESDSRLRKVYVLLAKDVTRKDVLERRARQVLALKQTRFRVDAIRVSDHPSAPFNVFHIGDTVLVDAEFDWIGRQKLWRRIVEIERVSEDVMDIFLED